MTVNWAAGFAVPLVVGRWSDRRHTARRGRRPFIVGAAVLAAGGLGAVAIGHGTSYRALFVFGGAATLAALVPLACSPSPESGVRLMRELR